MQKKLSGIEKNVGNNASAYFTRGCWIVYSELCIMVWSVCLCNMESSVLCLKTIEEAQVELPYSWYRASCSGICAQDLDTLIVWSYLQDIHGSQELEVFVHWDGIELKTMKEDGVN